MPLASLPQRLDEISKELDTLRARSLRHPENAAEMLQDGLEQIQVVLKGLTPLAGGGMTEAERDAFVEDKLACEHEKHLRRQEKLLDATRKVLAQKDLNSLLQTAADAARELTGANYATTGHGYVNGVFTAGGVSRSEGTMPCPPSEAFNVEKGGVYLDLIQEKNSIRLTDAEMRSHSDWWDLPEGHVSLRGLLGVRLVNVSSQPNVLMMVTDKEDGGDFTAEDETILSQLAAIISLALQHIEARLEVENKERRLDALMKALPVGVSFSDDISCQSITGNPAVLAQFEVKPEDNLSASAPSGNAPGRQVRYFMDGRQITDAELPLQRAVAENREIPPMELEVELQSGRRWFTEASGAPIRDTQGNVVGGVAVTVDTTERKRAEEALSESEAKLRAIFQSLAEGIVFFNTQGEVVEVNDAVQHIHGHTLQELADPRLDPRWQIIRPDGKLFPVDEQPAIVALSTREAVHDVEMGVRTSDGKLRWRLVNAQPVFDDNGNLLGAVASFFDITERKQAEIALQEAKEELEVTAEELRLQNEELVNAQSMLQESEEKYRSLFNNMTEAFYLGEILSDESGQPYDIHILDINNAYQRLINLPREKVVGRTHKEVFNVEIPWLGTVANVASSGTPTTFEYYSAVAGRWLEAYAYSPKRGWFASIIKDITEKKQAEEALRESVSTAERRSGELDAAISSIAAGVIIYDSSGRIVRMNDMALNMLGLSSTDLDPENYDLRKARIGTSKPDGTPLKTEEAPYYRALHGESIMEEEVLFKRPDREAVWVSTAASPIKSNKGEIIGAIAIFSDITERRQAEEALRTSEERLRTAIAGSQGAEWQIPADEMQEHGFGDEADLSPQCKRFIGFADDEFPNSVSAWRKRVHPDDLSAITTAARAHIEKRTPFYNVEYRIRHKDGSWRHLLTTGLLQHDSGGRPLRWIGIDWDITERKQAEDALKQRDAVIEAFFDSSPGILNIEDEEFRYIKTDKLTPTYFGLDRQTIVGKAVGDLAPEFIRDHGAMMRRVIETGQPEINVEVKSPVPSRPGEITYWRASYFPIPLPEGKRGIGIIGVEITDMKRAEDRLQKAHDELEQRVQERTSELTKANLALKKSEERFRVTLKNSPILVYNQNRDLRYTWIYDPNAAFSDTTILGKTTEELSLTEGAAQLTKIKHSVLKSGLEERAEIRTIINGKEFFYDTTVEPLCNASGEIEGITVVAIDITKRKMAENELVKAKDAAEEAVRAKSAFLANMSHELRTPMNSILGFTSLLLEEPLSVEYKDWLDTMKINGEALLALINDVLDFSKMEKDKVELETHPFNLRQRIEESLDLVSTKATEKGLDLAYLMDSNVPETIITDSARLRQVLANLLSNAVKFTDTGDVLVHVSSKLEGDFHEIHFAIQDTGIGMPQGQMSKLFQPFSQIDTAPSRLTEGTGLGLAISKKLVELMGGKIWAESEEGKGSTFIFTIKVKAAPDDTAIKLPAGPQPQLAKRNILIVDDNQTMRRLLGHQTKSWGMVPLVISLSYSAIELIKNGITPDVAIIDASMPDLNGIVTAQMIRRHRSDLPLIIMTSPGQHIPQNLLAVNLPKPIKPMQLYDALINLLEGRPIQVQCQDQAVDQTSASLLRILLAEDNVPSQQVAIQMLKKLGYKADVAANGVEVLQALERQPYDVVLMDIKMPEMDGLEATRIIRQRWPNGPKIIAITAYALEGDREKCLGAGMDGYIAKPVQIEDLARALKEINRLEV